MCSICFHTTRKICYHYWEFQILFQACSPSPGCIAQLWRWVMQPLHGRSVAGSVRLLNRMLEKHDKHRNVLHILLGGLLEAIDRHHDADADAVVGGNVDGFPHFLNLLAPYIVQFRSCLHARFFCGEISNLRIKSTALQTPCLLPVKYYGLELRRQVQLHSKPILCSSELMLEGSSIAALHGSLTAQCTSSSCKRGCSGCSHGGVQIAAV